MPRKASITRERILEVATALVREKGHERLTVRALAARLGCSTQPILYCFATMEELTHAVYARVDELHSQALVANMEQAQDPMLQIGLNYVHFAQAEPAWFRFLFQSNGFGEQNMERLLDAPALEPMINMLSAEAHISEAQARQSFLALFACAHGLASMLANNALTLDEDVAVQVLNAAFVGSLVIVKEDYHDGALG